MKTGKLMTILFCSVLLLTAGVYSASANYSITNSVDYPLNFILDRGESTSSKVIINNSSQEKKSYLMKAVDGVRTSSGNLAAKAPWSEQAGPGLWTQFDEEISTLDAGERRLVSFTIKIPGHAQPGTYPGFFTMQEHKTAETGTTTTEIASATLNTRYAYPFTINIPGEKITDFEFISFEYLKINDDHLFETAFSNNGTTNIEVKLEITVKDTFGSEYEKITDKILLYSGENCKKTYHLSKKPLIGMFTADLKLDYSKKDLFNNTETFLDTITSSASFTVIPWATIVIVIILLAAAFIIPVIIHHKNKKLLSKCVSYTVKENDSLAGIAKSLNVNWKIIAGINKIEPPYTISAGQKILIPPKK
jgi:nucleoid-associated protein YgaU